MAFQKNKKEILLIILSFVGLALTFLLLMVDLNFKNGVANQFCVITDYVNCDKIAASSFSHVGPIPVSVIGMVFYFFVIFYAIFTKNPAAFFKTASWFFLAASALSLFLLAVSVFSVQGLCIFCLGTYLVNWGALFLLRKELNFSGVFASSNILTAVLAAVLAIGFSAGSYFILERSFAAPSYHEAVTKYQQAPSVRLNTLFTPYRGAQDPKVTIIVYSDFFCHFCQQFSRTLDQVIKDPRYKDLVRVYYKVYPLDQECNKSVGRTLYQGSCALSALSMELMKKGLFWEYETRLGEMEPLTAQKGIALAEELNRGKMDLKKVQADNDRYLQINIQEAKALGIQGTPTWYLNGKRMDGAYDFQTLSVLLEYIKDKELK